MVLITIVTGAYKPTYNWGGLTLYPAHKYYVQYQHLMRAMLITSPRCKGCVIGV